MKTILCGLDFSESSRAALDEAAALARARHARLVLVHVEEPPLWTHQPYVHLPGDARPEALAGARDRLEAAKQEAGRGGAPEIATRLVDGVAWEQIVAIARADPTIELVVVGTHGRSGLQRALVGSVAEHVVRHAPCSVLVVRPRL